MKKYNYISSRKGIFFMIMMISKLCFNQKNPWGVNWGATMLCRYGGILGGNGGPPEMGVVWDLWTSKKQQRTGPLNNKAYWWFDVVVGDIDRNNFSHLKRLLAQAMYVFQVSVTGLVPRSDRYFETILKVFRKNKIEIKFASFKIYYLLNKFT